MLDWCIKQCNENFVVNEITIFKKSLNSCTAATAAAVGGEVWDYYPVASTSSSCSSSACSPTINTSTTNDNILSSIIVRRVASIVDDELQAALSQITCTEGATTVESSFCCDLVAP